MANKKGTGEISKEVPKKSQKEHMQLLLAMAKEEVGFKESLKGVKDACKDDGFDAAAMYKVAKSIADCKEADLVESCEGIIEIVNEYAKT